MEIFGSRPHVDLRHQWKNIRKSQGFLNCHLWRAVAATTAADTSEMQWAFSHRHTLSGSPPAVTDHVYVGASAHAAATKIH